MAFAPMQTTDASVVGQSKTLLMTHHGWGKTTQCKYYQQQIGPGFIISGESGLKSVSDVAIDYLPFSSWDGKHDPANGVYSFKGIVSMMESPEFKAAGYKWICIDSLTELSDRLLEHLEEVHRENKNTFEKWGDYGRLLIGALKWVRDLPYHVLVTSLAGEEQNDNGATEYWPLVKGQKVLKQIPGLFDNVLCGVKKVETEGGAQTVHRFIVTDHVKGWPGKVRDPRSRLKPVESGYTVPELLKMIAMNDDDYAALNRDSVITKAE